jgi:limonene-1,2-epoxide hydrolase
MIDGWELAKRAQDRAYFQTESLGICMGYMRNAMIDLQSGETKATAIATLQRGLALIEKRQAPMRELVQAIAMDAQRVETERLDGEAATARAEGIAQGESI